MTSLKLRDLPELPKDARPLLAGGFASLYKCECSGVPVAGFVLRLKNNTFWLVSETGKMFGPVSADDGYKLTEAVRVERGDLDSGFINELKSAYG